MSATKLAITAYSDSDFSAKVGKFEVDINPEKFTHQYKICYSDPQAQGSNGPSPDFNRMSRETMGFELVFDGTLSRKGAPAKDVQARINAFKQLAFTYNGNAHSPNYLKLVWGTLLFRCRLTTLELTYTLFRPDGTPLRARANVGFSGFTDEKTLAKKANKSSPDMSHLVRVRRGDVLPLMCYRVYGISDVYLEVARVNGLVNFSELEVGSELLFPPLEGARA